MRWWSTHNPLQIIEQQQAMLSIYPNQFIVDWRTSADNTYLYTFAAGVTFRVGYNDR